MEVHFPFAQPYQCQFEIMVRVIECIRNKLNGLIESPTGTGKTMAILCSAIATVQHMRRNTKGDKLDN